ncbi:MAG: dihydrolipoamide acetyltransferase family protein [Verrucomicrobia bacterium]|nr:dihydrolipoamide acetyltransferase family protein [Verrucomicrobiota bacterium]
MDIKLPKLGEGADSGSVVSVLVKEGDRVKKGQTVIELENEKAVAPIPSPAEGIVAGIRVKEGDKLSVGQVILTLRMEGEAAVAAPQKPAPREKNAPPPVAPIAATPAPAAATEEVLPELETESGLPPAASPAIRRLARELGLDLRHIRGSEPGGRIVMADLKSYLQRLERLAARARTTTAAALPARPTPPSIDFSQWGPVVKKPMTALRKTIAQRMTENWNTVPHVHQFDEVDISALNDLRQKFASAYEEKGARLTLTSFALVALAKALKKHPIFNASLDEAEEVIVFKQYVNIGLAVDTEAGLIVPVIRHVDQKTMLELSNDVMEVARKARERKVSLDDLKGGTCTISNQGGIGGGAFTPIINKPEAAILGLGRGVVKPVVRAGKIEPRLLMPICVGYDHRLIDGGSAARFVVDLVEAFGAFTEAEVKNGLTT